MQLNRTWDSITIRPRLDLDLSRWGSKWGASAAFVSLNLVTSSNFRKSRTEQRRPSGNSHFPAASYNGWIESDLKSFSRILQRGLWKLIECSTFRLNPFTKSIWNVGLFFRKLIRKSGLPCSFSPTSRSDWLTFAGWRKGKSILLWKEIALRLRRTCFNEVHVLWLQICQQILGWWQAVAINSNRCMKANIFGFPVLITNLRMV